MLLNMPEESCFEWTCLCFQCKPPQRHDYVCVLPVTLFHTHMKHENNCSNGLMNSHGKRAMFWGGSAYQERRADVTHHLAVHFVLCDGCKWGDQSPYRIKFLILTDSFILSLSRSTLAPKWCWEPYLCLVKKKWTHVIVEVCCS